LPAREAGLRTCHATQRRDFDTPPDAGYIRDVRGLFIEHLTWMELEATLKDFDTLLLPIGARSKEHGPHLRLMSDMPAPLVSATRGYR
jgi:hypothetical protein